ncbi:MAG TPA: 5-guanidino-2-oxopentanoate decarboxylase [Steroidobacteraceae bacterium]|nr:5-guanidino-2-oxopentanoate decarboxylase [Steroidobacteraceae bacterium]
MSTRMRTVGDYVVELLAMNGIDTVFGIPGVHNIELYRGLGSARLRHVLVRHEQNAGFAADGYARASGRPAAAFVISGPGLTNVLTAVGQAYSDSVPMLVIASTPARETLGKRWGVLHELNDQLGLAAGVTAVARTASSVEDVRDHLCAALTSLHGARARPAYVGIPLDLLAEPTTHAAERFAAVQGAPEAAADAIERAAALLAGAQRPLLIAGGGARAAGDALRQLVEALDAYLVTTAAGKGVLPESHPASLGASLPYSVTRELIAGADVVLAVGTELSETDIFNGMRLRIEGKLIRIDIDPLRLADQYGPEVAIWGDARTSLQALARAITPRSGWRTQSGGSARQRAAIEEQFDANARTFSAVLQTLRQSTPSDAIVFSDMTQIAYHGIYAFAAERPGVWVHPSGYGTLGHALPAALGAKIAQPRRAVLALAGDFGLGFTLQELTTAVECELALPIVVWNNGALGQIRDDMLRAGITPLGVVARNPDFIALARACGAEAVRVSTLTVLGERIRAALERRGPTLLELVSSDFVQA